MDPLQPPSRDVKLAENTVSVSTDEQAAYISINRKGERVIRVVLLGSSKQYTINILSPQEVMVIAECGCVLTARFKLTVGARFKLNSDYTVETDHIPGMNCKPLRFAKTAKKEKAATTVYFHQDVEDAWQATFDTIKDNVRERGGTFADETTPPNSIPNSRQNSVRSNFSRHGSNLSRRGTGGSNAGGEWYEGC